MVFQTKNNVLKPFLFELPSYLLTEFFQASFFFYKNELYKPY